MASHDAIDFSRRVLVVGGRSNNRDGAAAGQTRQPKVAKAECQDPH